jgi:hypothetical protein
MQLPRMLVRRGVFHNSDRSRRISRAFSLGSVTLRRISGVRRCSGRDIVCHANLRDHRNIDPEEQIGTSRLTSEPLTSGDRFTAYS